MGIFDRLGNLVKGGIAVARSDEGPTERAAREQALREELARLTPSKAAHDELAQRKGGVPVGAARSAAPAPTGNDPLAVELARLQKAYDDGVLTRSEMERKRTEAVARKDAPADGDQPQIKRTL